MNRYGRHGSGAWLRRHRRLRQRQTSTSLVSAKPFIPNVVINITVPAGVERVIVIMVGNAEGNDGNNRSDVDSPVIDSSLESPGAYRMRQHSKNAVQPFLEKIRDTYRSSPIYIDDCDVRSYAGSLASGVFEDYSFPTDQDYSLRDLKPIYIESFVQGLKVYSEEYCNLLSVEDMQIFEIVSADKKTHREITDASYLRELGTIGALEILQIDSRTARSSSDYLQKIHNKVDTYVDFYRSGEEVQKVHDLERFRNK